MGGRAYSVAWLFCLGVCFCHILSLSLVVTFDSQWYVRLADILGTSLFSSQWDYLRTPLFPALLKFSFLFLGRQAMAVLGLQACLACGGVWILARTIRSLGMPIESAICVAVLGCFPTLIAFQHVLLTEVGSFFFFSLVICTLARPVAASLQGATWIALALTLAYYHRSSFVYLAPIVGLVYVLSGLRKEWKGPARDFWNYFVRHALPQFLIVAFLPFVLAYPWQRNPKVTERNGVVLLYGLISQGVLPLNDPVLGGGAPLYRSAIEQSKSNGVFPNSGITAGGQYAVIDFVARSGFSASSIFLRVILATPLDYLKAVGRNLIMFSGVQGFDYDIALYRHKVLVSKTSQIDPGGSWMTPLGSEFVRTTAPNFTSLAFQTIAPIYDWLVAFGLLATLVSFFVGLWRLDKFILAFTAPALAFIAMHALLLVSQDRLILPVQPILLVNLVMFPAWLGLSPRFGVRPAFIAKKMHRISKTALAGAMAAVLGVAILVVVALRTDRKADLPMIVLATVPADLDGVIDNVNGAAPSQLGDADDPILALRGQTEVVEGWLSYGLASASVSMDDIFGVVNGNTVPAKVVKRPDVAIHFHNPKVENSGFRLEVDPQFLTTGSTRLDIVGRTKSDGKFHRLLKPIYLFVR